NSLLRVIVVIRRYRFTEAAVAVTGRGWRRKLLVLEIWRQGCQVPPFCLALLFVFVSMLFDKMVLLKRYVGGLVVSMAGRCISAH
ncbi:hypothetical protein, partial [Pontitalea aquivivens]|uniref:hypothetical protein n=1 Tax=Pontitalea aquivivens TaxID=3388663 RepID=UPI003970706D